MLETFSLSVPSLSPILLEGFDIELRTLNAN